MDSPQDRLAACWRYQNCYGCIHSPFGCGWCPSSSACIPASNLLEPLTRKDICPLREERFELRTKALGCGCSTTTLLSIIVTVFATMLALAVLYGIGVALWRVNATIGTGTWRGVEIEIKDDGYRAERKWKRKTWVSSLNPFRREYKPHPRKSEQDQVTERTRLLG